MTLRPTPVALAGLTVVAACLLVSVLAVGVAHLRSPGGLSVLIAVLAVLGVLMVEPYRRVRV